MPRIRLDLVTRPASRAWVMHVERALVAERRADPLEDPRHRLDVVREHLGAATRRPRASRSGLPLKSGIRISTPVPGLSAWICAHRLGVQPGAAVGQVVAGDAGDGGVAQAHRLHATRRPGAARRGRAAGLAGVDLAEVAAPGALVAADEEGRLAVLPALEDVGAAGLLADRVQALATSPGVCSCGVLRAHLRPGLDPLAACARSGVSALRTSRRSSLRPSGAMRHGSQPYGAALRARSAQRHRRVTRLDAPRRSATTSTGDVAAELGASAR